MSDQFVNATGRRKTSTARVRLRRGNGDFVVNGKKLDDYFGRAVLRLIIKQPFELLELDGKIDVIANCTGGGPVSYTHLTLPTNDRV